MAAQQPRRGDRDDAVGQTSGASDPPLATGLAVSVAVFRSSHPVAAALVALMVGLAALASGRSPREAAVVTATTWIGQLILGWHRDLVGLSRHDRAGAPAPLSTPVRTGRLEPGSLWMAIAVAVLLVVPLSISTGVTAGTYLLAALAVSLVGNVLARNGSAAALVLGAILNAVSWALLPAYLTYGGWGGAAEGAPPNPTIVGLAAVLGAGWHLVQHYRAGPRPLLGLALAGCAAAATAIAVVGAVSGWQQS